MRISGMVTSVRMFSSWENSVWRVMPLRNALVAASCMTTPSAMGSENGIPTSIMSMPLLASVRIVVAEPSSVGCPAQKYMDSIPAFFV